MLVLELLHMVAIGIPPSSAKVTQVCRNEYLVRFFSDVMSVFLRSLESPSAPLASSDSGNVS